jgi:hypothetical protein
MEKWSMEALDRIEAAIGNLLAQVREWRRPPGCNLPPGQIQPWRETDLARLERLPRRLLLYMQGRSEAELKQLCPLVWGEDYRNVTLSAVSTALCKANAFLNKQESARLLEKVRGESIIRWV